MDINKTFAVDEEKELKGVWRALLTPDEELTDAKVKVARINNPIFKQVQKRLFLEKGTRLTRLQNKQKRKEITPQQETELNGILTDISLKCLVEGCLLDWENIQGEDGEPIEFTKEKALEILQNFPVLVEQITEMASDMGSYRKEELEESEKNS